jgi:DNA-binding NarL/FixJ family response regulator
MNVSRAGDGSWRLAFATVHRRQLGLPGTRRATDLAEVLRQIATELQDVDIEAGSRSTHDILSVPGVRGLPGRQREIVVRLARGERVGTIAARMYLSANTVRNHLSAVFKKFGVHSQAELLAVLQNYESDGPPNGT